MKLNRLQLSCFVIIILITLCFVLFASFRETPSSANQQALNNKKVTNSPAQFAVPPVQNGNKRSNTTSVPTQPASPVIPKSAGSLSTQSAYNTAKPAQISAPNLEINIDVYNLNKLEKVAELEKQAAALDRSARYSCLIFNALRERLYGEAASRGYLLKPEERWVKGQMLSASSTKRPIALKSPALSNSPVGLTTIEIEKIKKDAVTADLLSEAMSEYKKNNKKSCGELLLQWQNIEQKLDLEHSSWQKTIFASNTKNKSGYGYDLYQTNIAASQTFGAWLSTKIRRFAYADIFGKIVDTMVSGMKKEKKIVTTLKNPQSTIYSRFSDVNERCFSKIFEDGILFESFRLLGETEGRNSQIEGYLSHLECSTLSELHSLDRALALGGGFTLIALSDEKHLELRQTILQAMLLFTLPVVDMTKRYGVTPALNLVHILNKDGVILRSPKKGSKDIITNNGGVNLWYREKKRWTKIPLNLAKTEISQNPQSGTIVTSLAIEAKTPFGVNTETIRQNTCTPGQMEMYLGNKSGNWISYEYKSKDVWIGPKGAAYISLNEIVDNLSPLKLGFGTCGIVGQIKYGGYCPHHVCDNLLAVKDEVENVQNPKAFVSIKNTDGVYGTLFLDMIDKSGTLSKIIPTSPYKSISIGERVFPEKQIISKVSSQTESNMVAVGQGFVKDELFYLSNDYPNNDLLFRKKIGAGVSTVAKRVSCLPTSLFDCLTNKESCATTINNNKESLPVDFEGCPVNSIDFQKSSLYFMDIMAVGPNKLVTWPAPIMPDRIIRGVVTGLPVLYYIAKDALPEGTGAFQIYKEYLENIKAFDGKPRVVRVDLFATMTAEQDGEQFGSPWYIPAVTRYVTYFNPTVPSATLRDIVENKDGFLGISTIEHSDGSGWDLILDAWNEETKTVKNLASIPFLSKIPLLPPNYVRGINMNGKLVVVTDRDIWIGTGSKYGRRVSINLVWDNETKTWGLDLSNITAITNESGDLLMGESDGESGRIRRIFQTEISVKF